MYINHGAFLFRPMISLRSPTYISDGYLADIYFKGLRDIGNLK